MITLTQSEIDKIINRDSRLPLPNGEDYPIETAIRNVILKPFEQGITLEDYKKHLDQEESSIEIIRGFIAEDLDRLEEEKEESLKYCESWKEIHELNPVISKENIYNWWYELNANADKTEGIDIYFWESYAIEFEKIITEKYDSDTWKKLESYLDKFWDDLDQRYDTDINLTKNIVTQLYE